MFKWEGECKTGIKMHAVGVFVAWGPCIACTMQSVGAVASSQLPWGVSATKAVYTNGRDAPGLWLPDLTWKHLHESSMNSLQH